MEIEMKFLSIAMIMLGVVGWTYLMYSWETNRPKLAEPIDDLPTTLLFGSWISGIVFILLIIMS